MLFSFALILIIGFGLSGICKKLHIPGLFGMILTGILLGPSLLNLISREILVISPDLREIALIVILTRAGLSIDLKDLKKVGRPAILMCFLPATLEILLVGWLSPILFSITPLEGFLLGTVLAAVSPAVIVPRMLHLMELGKGKEKSIPQLIMAGASIDDIYVIILFSSLLSIYEGGSFDIKSLLLLPTSILLGALLGGGSGFLLVHLFKKIHMRDTVKVLILMSISFLFVTLESFLKPWVSISGLIAVMALGASLTKLYPVLSKRITGKFSKIWVAAEILLFVLVGAQVQVDTIPQAGMMTLLLLLFALIFRIVGVQICLLRTHLNWKERLFCSLSYLPKATVQAAIGAIPLQRGVEAGNLILTIAVIAILVTAPLGAMGIDWSSKYLE